jgi:hypothetical protein
MIRFALFFILFTFHCIGEMQREFDGIPYSLDLSGSKEEGFLLKCFDWKDPQFGSEGVPFLIMEIKEEADIVALGKTCLFSGKKIVSLALSLLKEFGVSVLHLTDTSTSLPCEWDGKWCCDEAMMDMRMTSVFIKGMSFYESLGAVSDDAAYTEAARFLHDLPLPEFANELSRIPSAQSQIELLKEICTALNTPDHLLTMGGLASSLYTAGKQNEYAHCLWHRFHDSFIAEKEGIFIPYLLQEPDPELHALFKDEVAQLEHKGFNLEGDITEFRLSLYFDKLAAFSHSPALFLPSRASDQCHRNTVRMSSLIQNHPKLIPLYRMEIPSKNHSRPKSLLTQWFLAKQTVRKTKRFTFIN